MQSRIAKSFIVAMLFATTATAEVPSVAVDIAPVHSLVAQVMGDLGAPTLIVPQGASPHSHAMRPSEARALSEAGLVVWVGEDLEPWLETPIRNLGQSARVLTLSEVPGTVQFEMREDAVFSMEEDTEHHDGDTDHDGHDDHAEHDDQADHDDHESHDDHDDHADHDDHEAHDDHKGHVHEGADPHLWLDPENGRVWLAAIAEALAYSDPENADVYRANAEAGIVALVALEARIVADLASVQDMRFVVLHDAYRYFEERFGLSALGAISKGDATDPSAARVAALRDEMRSAGVTCILSQPQFNASLIDAVTEGRNVGLAVLDPLGVDLEPGPDLYGALLQGLADGLRNCK
ncbi:zinc ABC transporter substrate-binding protein [Tropicimonas sediminicola]|uniref:High-affinity zinc uptake system protein ZnuA n=1 Tax=Tropicimonas sediminicola TaxID=1031541 RepID=A0A239KCJ3_9RHOB|nr:zinc ABC transporter substrate-binding protein [Tropicimonas sediminicola]SNT15680.1 zinc transport system substrate-binding protein [Tropicimonas sediminicola]